MAYAVFETGNYFYLFWGKIFTKYLHQLRLNVNYILHFECIQHICGKKIERRGRFFFEIVTARRGFLSFVVAYSLQTPLPTNIFDNALSNLYVSALVVKVWFWDESHNSIIRIIYHTIICWNTLLFYSIIYFHLVNYFHCI